MKLKLFQPFHNFVHDVICQVHINVFQVRNFLLVIISLLCSFITNPSSSWLFCLKNIHYETIILEVKVTLFNVGSSFSPDGTAINGSRRCALYPPLPLSVLRFTGIQSYSYTDQRKVEADVEVTEDRTGDLSLRKPRTSQLSHNCSYYSHYK